MSETNKRNENKGRFKKGHKSTMTEEMKRKISETLKKRHRELKINKL